MLALYVSCSSFNTGSFLQNILLHVLQQMFLIVFFAEATMLFQLAFYKSLSSFTVTPVSWDSYPSAPHHKCSAVPGDLLIKFSSSEKSYIWS